MASLYCSNCGSPVAEGSKFCTSCGAPAPVAQPVPTNPAEQDSAVQMPVQMPAEPVIEPEAVNKDDTVIFAPPPIQIDVKAEQEQDNSLQPAQNPSPVTRQQTFTQPTNPASVQSPVPIPSIPQHQQGQLPVQNNRQSPISPVQQPSHSYGRSAVNSPYALMGVWDIVGSIILMSLPVVGLIFSIIWAAGGCQNLYRRNLARACLLLLAITIVLSIVSFILFCTIYSDMLTHIFETLFPGYTIEWGF